MADHPPLAPKLSWIFIREEPEGCWSVGGQSCCRATASRTLHPLLNSARSARSWRQAAVVARVHAETAAALGEDPGRLRSFCWIDGGAGLPAAVTPSRCASLGSARILRAAGDGAGNHHLRTDPGAA